MTCCHIVEYVCWVFNVFVLVSVPSSKFHRILFIVDSLIPLIVVEKITLSQIFGFNSFTFIMAQNLSFHTQTIVLATAITFESLYHFTVTK